MKKILLAACMAISGMATLASEETVTIEANLTSPLAFHPISLRTEPAQNLGSNGREFWGDWTL